MTLLQKFMIRFRGPALLRAIANAIPRIVAPARPRATIAVEVVEDPFYLGLFGELAARIRRSHNVAFSAIVVRSLAPGAGRGASYRLRAAVHSNRATDFVWLRAFARFCDRIAYRSAQRLGAKAEARVGANARALLDRCKTADQLEMLEIDGVKIGDLVIDSFLRFRPAVRIDLTDPYLLEVLTQALRDIEKAKTYFNGESPALYLTTYTTYIQHGVPARVALKSGIPVIAFGNFQDVYKRLSVEDSAHTKAFINYSAEFSSLSDSQSRRRLGAENLELRVRGEIDKATSYMAKSAYANSLKLEHDVQGALVIFLHDFYDSAHIYGWMIFHDFWDWVTFTIDSLINAGVKFVVKPHPNQIAAGAKDLADLRAKYPDVTFLPSAVSNRQLVDAGMAGAITVYGTVACEMAYLGLPALCCGNHPHISFDFATTAGSREDYRRLLATFHKEPTNKDEFRNQAAEFYYMHNLAHDPETAEVRSAMTKFWMACIAAADSKDAVHSEPAVAALRDLSSLTGFDAAASELARAAGL